MLYNFEWQQESNASHEVYRTNAFFMDTYGANEEYSFYYTKLIKIDKAIPSDENKIIQTKQKI